MIPKNKMWKAEKQEDLAFYAESDRIKLLLSVTLKKINALLCCTNNAHILLDSMLMLQQKEENLIQNFVKICVNAEFNESRKENIGTLANRMIEGLSLQVMQEIATKFSLANFENAILFYKTLHGLFDSLGNRLGSYNVYTSIDISFDNVFYKFLIVYNKNESYIETYANKGFQFYFICFESY